MCIALFQYLQARDKHRCKSKGSDMTSRFSMKSIALMSSAVALMCLPAGIVSAQGVTFTDVTASTGVTYARTPSLRDAGNTSFLQDSLITPATFFDLVQAPMRGRGIPGVALLDYDGDGDLDMYVTNGPGSANSLLSNQLVESGTFTFVDVTAAAGVEASAQDSNGTCFGDIDNDGDEDLFVVGHEGAHHLFENQGNGSFLDISASSPFATNGIGGTACAFGDINGDGLLDLFVARGYSLNTLEPCLFHSGTNEFQHNELYVNTGSNIFQDVSATSGIRDMGDYPVGMAGLTWAASLVDYDLDGDLDLFNADDQCAALPAKHGGVDRGTISVWDNDGSGNFTNVTPLSPHSAYHSDWMGLSFGDFNHDGSMDFFATNFGDWAREFLGAPYTVNDGSSHWFHQQPDHTFVRNDGGQPSTPFGWGTVAEDFDRDGDTDVMFIGGLSLGFAGEASNPGSYLINDGTGNFDYDPDATLVDHNRRFNSGAVAGDLNGDGHVDFVTVSNENFSSAIPLVPYAAVGIQRGSDFDADAFFVPTFAETSQGSGEFVWTGIGGSDGTIAIETNDGTSAYGAASVTTIGTIGLTDDGSVNRDGIGAVVFFTPKNGAQAMKPVAGGSSHVSQNSLTQHFGMGDANKGTVEVMWPGGVRNRLYNVKDGDQVRFPEIPCSYDAEWDTFQDYKDCVKDALKDLKQEGVITGGEKGKLLSSAIKAYHDHND